MRIRNQNQEPSLFPLPPFLRPISLPIRVLSLSKQLGKTYISSHQYQYETLHHSLRLRAVSKTQAFLHFTSHSSTPIIPVTFPELILCSLAPQKHSNGHCTAQSEEDHCTFRKGALPFRPRHSNPSRPHSLTTNHTPPRTFHRTSVSEEAGRRERRELNRLGFPEGALREGTCPFRKSGMSVDTLGQGQGGRETWDLRSVSGGG